MLEPNVVVPMHYKLPRLKVELEDVERFLNEMGAAEPKEENSLKITSTGLPEETETIILRPKI